MRAIRDEQLRQRREAAACSVERERAHWERGREEWVRENRREEEVGEGRRKVGHGNLATLFRAISMHCCLICTVVVAGFVLFKNHQIF